MKNPIRKLKTKKTDSNRVISHNKKKHKIN